MKVSVIIPCFNSENYIHESITSVLDQTYPADEVIVVDDGSTDNTAKIAHSFGPPVRVIQKTNEGPSIARNIGIENSKGDFIAFLDSDDLWDANKLEQQIRYMKRRTHAVGVVCGFSNIGNDEHHNIHIGDALQSSYQPIDYLSSPKIHTSTLFVDYKSATSLRFPENIHYAEELIYTAQLRAIGPIGSVEKILARRRHHPSQVTEGSQYFCNGIIARIAWAKENYRLINLDSAGIAVSAILNGALQEVMINYWKRDFHLFKRRRAELLSIWPDNIPIPKELSRYLPPKIFIRAKDTIDNLLHKKASVR